MIEKPRDEQSILREAGINRAAYHGSWIYESSDSTTKRNILLAFYYEINPDDISTDIKHWYNIQYSRVALRQLLSSMNLEGDIFFPSIQNGRFHFFNELKPAASYYSSEISDASSISRKSWKLSLWDEEKQAIYIVKFKN